MANTEQTTIKFDISIIICTRNRAYAITPCLDATLAAINNCLDKTCEIVIVDNGSTDDTAARIKEWAATRRVNINIVKEPKAGLSNARNRGLDTASGNFLIFTDDDCHMDKTYITEAMKLYASSDDLTLFGGRVELGDPADLPLTIKTDTEAKEWHISNNSSRHDNLGIAVVGCNMAASRSLFQKLGHFDTKLGAGTAIGGGEDVDLVYRSYLKGAHIKYAPEIVVYHFHGRRLEEDGKKLTLRYSIGAGALYAKYILRHPNFCRSFYWDLRKMINDIKRKENNFRPDIGLTYVDLIGRNIAGALLFYYVSFLSLFKNNTVRKGH